MWPYKVVLRCQHDFAVMVLSEGSLLTTAPFIMVLQTSVPILSGEIASKRPLPIFRWHLYREVETCDQRQFITRRRGHGVLSPLSSVLRGESGGRGGDRSPLLGQAGADGRHLLIPADLNIQIRDKLFIHWNLSGVGGSRDDSQKIIYVQFTKYFAFKFPSNDVEDNWGREMADSDIGKRYWQQLNVVN